METGEDRRRIPISAWIEPAAWIRHREAMSRIVARHPLLFGEGAGATRDYDAVSGTYAAGAHTDAWGCVWTNVHPGMEAVVTGHPVPTREYVHALEFPREDIGFPHGFMYLRLLDLRGFEEAMCDFAEEPPELQLLIDKVLEYNLRQAQLRLAGLTERSSLVVFGDDLGMQKGLAIGAAKWRRYLKPCFTRIYAPFKAAGHRIYMHTDGWILDIIPDLADCGVDVLNPQVRANGLANLAAVFRAGMSMDLDLDRQLFPLATPDAIRRHVMEAVETLGQGPGRLSLKGEIGPDVPLENAEALFAAMEEVSGYRGNASVG
ncbi:MAG: uroporphyrinogen decarboxylase family protein [Candidatus Coatesbacteria bacterium]